MQMLIHVFLALIVSAVCHTWCLIPEAWKWMQSGALLSMYPEARDQTCQPGC
jgi:hypothetical protein